MHHSLENELDRNLLIKEFGSGLNNLTSINFEYKRLLGREADFNIRKAGFAFIFDTFCRQDWKPPISKIHPQAFQECSNLTELNLYLNQLKCIEANTFQGLAKLENLCLGCNSLILIDPMAFQNLTKLKELKLHGNKLEKINSSWFEDLVNLEILTLHENSISRIDSKCFKSFNVPSNKIKTLTLFANRWPYKSFIRDNYIINEPVLYLSWERNLIEKNLKYEVDFEKFLNQFGTQR
jgi:Leucine-rich repeat (LRR) protein